MSGGVGKCLRIPTDCIEVIPSLHGNGFSSLVGQDPIPILLDYDALGNICGLASFTSDSVVALEWGTFKVNIFQDVMDCTRVTDTITHEIGHCIGVLKYTTDEELMDEKADGSSEIKSFVTAMLSLLYTPAPGTDICDQLPARRPGSMLAMSRYQADRGKRCSRS